MLSSLTVRRRALLAGAVALLVGYFWITWSVNLGLNLIHSYHGVYGSSCPAPAWEHAGYSCAGPLPRVRVIVLLVVVAALLVVVGLLLARWVMRPVRRLAEVAGRLGPQNLAERLPDLGGDELGAGAREVNALLERISAGYDSQRRFAADASHELRTPLALQRTLIEVGLAQAPTPEQLDLLVRQLLSANHRNESLVEGLLALAESDRGLASSTPQRLDLVAATVCEQYARIAAAAGVTVTTALAPVTVDGEGVLLDRLVANLLHNGVKYNVPGGAVAIGVGPGPELVVSNDGPVVPAPAVPGLFEPFRRLVGDRIDHAGGSGLGLTIVRSIALAHRASVRAEARPTGGLVVTVSFPG